MNRISKLLIVAILVLACGSVTAFANPKLTQDSDEAKPTKVVLVLKLDSKKIAQLQTTGVLSTTIPREMVNRVGAIRISRKSSFLKDSLKIDASSDKLQRTLKVEVDNSILQRLEYQPVEMKIYDSGFDLVSLRFNARGIVAGEVPQQVKIEMRPEDSPMLYVRVNESRGLYGTLKGMSKFPMKTNFGNVEIPGNQIKGIRLNTDKNNSAFVVLHSGDEFTATFEDKKVVVNSWWGTQELSLSELESLTLTRESKFVGAKDNKWRIQSGLAAPRTNLPTIQNPIPQFNR